MIDKKNTRKIYVVGNDIEYANWMEGEVTENMSESDVVLLTGGSDVSPDLYNEKVGKFTTYNTTRDIYELEQIKLARQLNKPIFGICRGLQLIGVVNDAILIQHMSHPYKHLVKFYDETKEYTNSLHHQMVKPFYLPKEKYHIIAYSEGLSNEYLNGNDNTVMMKTDSSNKNIEPEIIFFPETNMLGVQFHPEMLSLSSRIVEICQKLLDLQISGELDAVLKLQIPIKRLMEEELCLTDDENQLLDEINLKLVSKGEEILESEEFVN